MIQIEHIRKILEKVEQLYDDRRNSWNFFGKDEELNTYNYLKNLLLEGESEILKLIQLKDTISVLEKQTSLLNEKLLELEIKSNSSNIITNKNNVITENKNPQNRFIERNKNIKELKEYYDKLNKAIEKSNICIKCIINYGFIMDKEYKNKIGSLMINQI